MAGGEQTPNPKKCTHGFSGFKHKIAIISIPRGVVTENSSDLDSGRRPKLRSVEFFVTTPLVIEIRGRLFVTFPDFVYTYWDSESLSHVTKVKTIMVRSRFSLFRLHSAGGPPFPPRSARASHVRCTRRRGPWTRCVRSCRCAGTARATHRARTRRGARAHLC